MDLQLTKRGDYTVRAAVSLARGWPAGGYRKLREISDESAYARHLAHHGVSHSAAEWRRFSEHRMRSKYARAKCC